MPEKKNPAREQQSYPVAEDIEGTLSILSALPCRPGTPFSVPLKDIPGRTAAASVKAPFSLPGFRRSRFDGFALSSAELLNASPSTPVTLAVSAFLPAGSPLSSLAPGTCARIMTGAALPDGADCVVPFEEAGPEISRRVRFTAPASPGRCIGATDSDLATGETVIRKGSLLTPLSAARAALSGQTEIRVYPRPSAAVLSTGSELITPGTPLTPGKIYNSSQYAICGVITQEGCRAVPSGTVPDRSDAIAERITALLGENDCVITTGGVGGGDCDLMAGASHQGRPHACLGRLPAPAGRQFSGCLFGGQIRFRSVRRAGISHAGPASLRASLPAPGHGPDGFPASVHESFSRGAPGTPVRRPHHGEYQSRGRPGRLSSAAPQGH